MYDRFRPFRSRSVAALALLIGLAFAAGGVAAPSTASAQSQEADPPRAKKHRKKKKRSTVPVFGGAEVWF